MSLHRFNGTQMQQQYGLSEGTQRVQTTPNNYGPQPVLVHDEISLALGRAQAYSATVQCSVQQVSQVVLIYSHL